MTAFPNFTDPQFLDALGTGGLNAAMGVVSGSVASVGSGNWAVPGLLSPEAMTVGFASLVANITLPLPWGIVASSGAVVRAHGTQTGADTQSYSVNFAPLVPGSSSITAFLAATITQIQQNPFAITGPPPGDPAYNPNFVPTTGYATNLYTVTLAAVSGGIDNINTFELFRTTLTAGQSSITTYTTSAQVRAVQQIAQTGLGLVSGGTLVASQLQQMLVPTAINLTHTLPPASGCTGLFARGTNTTSGAWTISTNGSDHIQAQGAALSSITVAASGSFALWSDGAAWWESTVPSTKHIAVYQINGGVQQVSIDNGAFTNTNATIIPTPPNGRVKVRAWGAGGGAGGCNSGGLSGSGGGGAYFETIITGVTSNISVSIGAGGAGGNSIGPTNGSAGGNTVVGSLTADGGTGGGAQSGTGQGTAGTGGVTVGVVAYSQSGTAGSVAYTVGSLNVGGLGGGAFGGGLNAPVIGGTGVAAIGSPGQYPGQGATGSLVASGGNAGAGGMVIAEWET